MGGGWDSADIEECAAEGDQEHEDCDEERCAQNDGRADMPSGTPRRMSAMTARMTMVSTAMAIGAATGTATARTMMTIVGSRYVVKVPPAYQGIWRRSRG